MVYLLLLGRGPTAPDFARCVDIHRKPGYDPVELFMDPTLRWPRPESSLEAVAERVGHAYI